MDHGHHYLMYSFKVFVSESEAPHSLYSSDFIKLGIITIIQVSHHIGLSVPYSFMKIKTIHIYLSKYHTVSRITGHVIQCEPPLARDNSLDGKVIIVFSNVKGLVLPAFTDLRKSLA